MDFAQCLSSYDQLSETNFCAPNLHRFKMRAWTQGPYDSPFPIRNDNRSMSTFSLSSVGAVIAPMPSLSQRDMDDAVEEIQKVLELFLPSLPFKKLRLCILLAIVSGDPILPLEEVSYHQHAPRLVLRLISAKSNCSERGLKACGIPKFLAIIRVVVLPPAFFQVP